MENNANKAAESDMTRKLVKESFIERLDEAFQDRVVTVEFSCRDCCKKAIGGILTRIGKDFIELSSVLPFPIVTFFPGNIVPLVEFATSAIIPLDNVCGVESLCI